MVVITVIHLLDLSPIAQPMALTKFWKLHPAGPLEYKKKCYKSIGGHTLPR